MLAWLKSGPGRVMWKTWQGWQEDDGFLLSAAMAYYAAFSLFPLCLVLIAILGGVLRFSSQAEDAQTKLLSVVGQNAGPWLADQLSGLLQGVRTQAGLSGPIGAFALLAAAIGGFLQFDSMLDRIWRTQGNGGVKSVWGYLWAELYNRLSAFLMLLAVAATLLIVLVANMVLAGIATNVEKLPGGHEVWEWSRFGLTVLSNTLLFTIVYRVVPKVPVRWRDAAGGGLFVAIVWLIGQRLLITFLIGSHYTAYGIVGTFIAVMLWLYYASTAVFLGTELVRAWLPRQAKRALPALRIANPQAVGRALPVDSTG